MSASADLQTQLSAVVASLGQAPLRSSVAELEIALAGRDVKEISGVIASKGVTEELLRSAVAARNTFGKINDVIHAAAIALSLPHVLEPGETLASYSERAASRWPW